MEVARLILECKTEVDLPTVFQCMERFEGVEGVQLWIRNGEEMKRITTQGVFDLTCSLSHTCITTTAFSQKSDIHVHNAANDSRYCI